MLGLGNVFFTTITMALSIWPSCIRGGHCLLTFFLGCQGLLPGPSPGTQTCRACPARGRRRQFYGKSFLSYVHLGKGPLHSSEPVSALSCPSLSPLLLTDKAHLAGCGCTATWSFCQMSLHSPFPGPGLFPSRSPWNGSERLHTDTGSWSPVECICKRGKFPFAFSLNI